MSAIPNPVKADDVESAVTDGSRSVVAQQLSIGVAVRMAVLERISRSLAAQ